MVDGSVRSRTRIARASTAFAVLLMPG